VIGHDAISSIHNSLEFSTVLCIDRLTTMASKQSEGDDNNASGLFRRSWTAFFPFSSSALASLPDNQRPVRYTREDDIPDANHDVDGQRPTIRDYNAINSVPPQVRVPKKVATSLKVEGKVWFANERS
jgi:hypothetical protein